MVLNSYGNINSEISGVEKNLLSVTKKREIGKVHDTFWIFVYWTVFLLLLFISNAFWTKNKPEDYDTCVKNENK